MDDEDIHDRLERLEATVADQQQTIEQLTEPPAVGRRGVLASLLGAGAVGGLAGYGSQSARAQASGPAGQVGTGEEPVDVEAWNLTVQDELNALGISFQNLEDGQVAAGDGSGGLKAITPGGAEIQSGTVSQTLDDAPADDTWGTNGTNELSVSFPEAFSETPVVVASGSVAHVIRGVISIFSVSTTGFDIRHYQFADLESDSGDVQWVAIA